MRYGADIGGLRVQSIRITHWKNHKMPQTCKAAALYPKVQTRNYPGGRTAQSRSRGSRATELSRAPSQLCQLLKAGEALGRKPNPGS